MTTDCVDYESDLPVIRRRKRYATGIFVLGFCIYVTACVYLLNVITTTQTEIISALRGPIPYILLFLGMALGSLIYYLVFGVIATHILVTRELRRVRRHGYNICVQCGRTLDEHNMQGTCPNCGTAFDLECTRRLWMSENSK